MSLAVKGLNYLKFTFLEVLGISLSVLACIPASKIMHTFLK